MVGALYGSRESALPFHRTVLLLTLRVKHRSLPDRGKFATRVEPKPGILRYLLIGDAKG
jgi:hypothetical protein